MAVPAAAAPPTTIAEQMPVATGGAMVLLTVGAAGGAWYLPLGVNWIVMLTLIAVFLLLAGKAITGRALGVLINERKLMSVSRLQLVIWTALIISAFFVIAVERIRNGADISEPLAIGIDWHIWALLGISTVSFVGTPLLSGNKKTKDPDPASNVVANVAARFGETAADVNTNRQGILYANTNIADARFTDMFQGDEIGNTQFVDISKVQMFFFTVIVAIAYAAQLFQMIRYGDLYGADVTLPQIQDGLLALMGVSHAGYLGAKSIDHTPTA